MSDAPRRSGCVWTSCCLAACLWAASAASATAQDLAKTSDSLMRFTGPRWSLIRPARDFQGGCAVGFLSFRFDPTGYFIFNNRVRGAWWIDELGNLKLRTREGVRFTLLVEGNTLRPTRNLPFPFLNRTSLFQRCPA